MQITNLNLQDELPLTCSRKGTCCHGNLVHLNPWELASMAKQKQRSIKEFRDSYTQFGGIVLKFNGAKDYRGKKACDQYIENFGCSVHEARPLACRLFPLARKIQNEEVNYIHEGLQFPCFEGCAEVKNLPKLSVENYLIGQATKSFEDAQDAYLEIMQNLADIGLMLLLDTDLVKTDAKDTLYQWQKAGNESPETIYKNIEPEWIDLLMCPDISFDRPLQFAAEHNLILQTKAQAKIDQLKDIATLKKSATLFIRMALYLAIAIGADAKALSELWIEIAKANGAEN